MSYALFVVLAACFLSAEARLMNFAPLPEGPLSAQTTYLGVSVAADMVRPSSALYGELPSSFDARVAWPGCLRGVLNQMDCGSCWSFASTTVLSSRFCIESGGAVNVSLSPENLLECEKLNLKCTMGSLPEWAWEFMVSTGVATIECVPYVSGGGHTPPCETQCTSSSLPYTLYKAANYTHYGDVIDPESHVQAIMAAIVSGGPVSADFNVYSSFDSYTGGVYKRVTGDHYEGLHSVTLIGFGTLDGVDFWLAQNSWGESWGPYGGYFMIARGVNECGIETLVYGGSAAL